MKNKYKLNRGLPMFLGILFTSFLGYAQNLQPALQYFKSILREIPCN